MTMTLLPTPAHCRLLLCGMAMAGTAQAQQAAEPAIKDFLADTGGTYVGAGGIIGLDNKLMSNAAAPKDFVVALGQGQADMSKAGFGIAWAPWRSKVVESLRMDISQHANSTGYLDNAGRRFLSGLTFSYAQNHKELDNKVQYPQSAWALFTEYYPRVDDDPTVRAYKWIVGTAAAADLETSAKSCLRLKQLRDEAAKVADGATDSRARQVQAMGRMLGGLSPAAVDPARGPAAAVPDLAAEYRLAKRRAALERAAGAQAAAATVAGAAATGQPVAAPQQGAEDLVKLIGDCAAEALEASRKQWNAAKLTLLAGRGNIRGPNAGDPTLSLGTHLQLGYQWAPADNKDMLLKLTMHHAGHALDLDTLTKTPAYGSRTLAALRYMYGWGEDRQLFYLAEVSNLNQRSAGVMSGAFKYVIGVDKKLADSLWLEFRYGRSQVRASEKEETKAMANLKFSFDSELASLKPAQ